MTSEAALDFDKLYRELHGRVEHFVMRFVNNDEQDAKDITQAAFMRAITYQGRFGGRSSLYTWICAIAKHIAYVQYKRNKRNADFFVFDHDFDLPDEHSDPAKIYEAMRAAESVSNLLGKISQNSLDVYEAVFQDGLSYPDAAAKLNIPIGTVRSRLSRLRGKIMEVV